MIFGQCFLRYYKTYDIGFWKIQLCQIWWWDNLLKLHNRGPHILFLYNGRNISYTIDMISLSRGEKEQICRTMTFNWPMSQCTVKTKPLQNPRYRTDSGIKKYRCIDTLPTSVRCATYHGRNWRFVTDLELRVYHCQEAGLIVLPCARRVSTKIQVYRAKKIIQC